MKDIRPIDGNGHVPDFPDDADECENPAACAECLRDDPAYQLGYREGYEQALLKLSISLLEQASVDATDLRKRLEKLAA